MQPKVLHPRDLAGCEHRLALDWGVADQSVLDQGGGAAVATGGSDPITLETPPDVARRQEAATAFRIRIRDFLRGIHSDHPEVFAVIDADAAPATRVADTLRACREEKQWIWNATLPIDRAAGRRGHAELLLRHGDGYLPVIVVNHRISTPRNAAHRDPTAAPTLTTSPLWGWLPAPDPYRSGRQHRRDQLRLGQLLAMLDDLELSPTLPIEQRRAGVIGLDADCIVVHRADQLLADYLATFERRQQIAAGQISTEPKRIGECRSCPWWTVCGPELTARRDVSLVVIGKPASVLTDAGITTIDQLAEYRGTAPEQWPTAKPFDDAILAAIAWRDEIPLVRRTETPTVRRADIEVDVDMESFGEDGAYLWGTLLTDTTDPGRPVVYRPFVTWDPLPTRDEGRSFAEFWAWLTAERVAAHEAGKTFAAYCYSEQAENRWLRGSADRFAGMPGIPSRAEVDEFIASDEWVDIFESVSRNFICPNGKGLKVVAPVAGFSWRDPDADGAASMDWYRLAVGLDGGAPDLSQRERLLIYNEDDVVATKVLREWIDEQAADRLPLAADLLSSGARRA